MPDELQIDKGALIFASLAEVYIDAGMLEEAITILKDGLLRNPSYNFGHFLLGKAYYLKNDFDSAQKQFEEVVRVDPSMISSNLYLGHIFRNRKEVEKARGYYSRVVELNSNHAEAKSWLEELKPLSAPPPPSPPPPLIEDELVVREIPVKKEEEVKPVEVADALKAEEKAKLEEIARIVGAPPMEIPVEEVIEETAVQEKITPEVVVQEPEVKEVLIPELPVQEIPAKAKLDEAMSKLVGLESVKGALVTTKDGLLIGNYLRSQQDADEYAALASAIYNEATSCFDFLEQGQFERGVIEKKEETIYLFTSKESLLSVITTAKTKPGLIFTVCGKVMDEIRGILE